MNHQYIKEIAKQAGLVSIDRKSKYFQDSMEKFAELIVGECFVKLTPYLDDQFIDDIESELKEHFGVEE